MKRIAGCVGSLLLVLALRAEAFELKTHRLVSQVAYLRSSVSHVLETELDLDPLRVIRSGAGWTPLLPADWVAEGSVREDDALSLALVRVRHHFFDPVFDRPLTLETPAGNLSLGERAPDWALEDRDTYVTQRFSYRDAREAFASSLTAPRPGEREVALAETLESLGHVVHLIQDMAVPEHVRNDVHVPIGEHQSLYEHRVDQLIDELVRRPYPRPEFASPRDFWVSPGQDGSGLAEFANRHFVSTGTNFTVAEAGARGGGFPSPVLDLATMHDVDVQSLTPVPLRDRRGRPLEGVLTFFGAPVVDVVAGQESFNDRLTTLSFFDRDLASVGDARLFSLNRFNLERAAEFLVPRAIGYSAGLLDYFFRGRLEASFEDDPRDSTRALLRVVNRGPDPIGPGTLTLYLDGPDGDRRPAPGGAITLAAPVAPGDPAPALAVSGELEAQGGAIVFRGGMGAESEGVVGKVLGAPSVEQIFRGGTDWILRTPDGLFPLGLGLGPTDVRWGERDNMVVAMTDRGGAIEFAIYRINRPEGDRSVPLHPSGRVHLLPAGVDRLDDQPISLGTTIEYRNVTHYSQALVTVLQELVVRTRPDGSSARQERYSLLDDQTIGARDYTLARTAALALAAGQPPDGVFSWEMIDFFLSRAGEVHVIVQIFLESAPGFTVPTWRHSFEGELVPDPFGDTFVNQSAPPAVRPLFVVNLARRTVVAKTCQDLIRVVVEHTERRNALEFYLVEDRDGTITAGYVPVRDMPAAKPGDTVLFRLEGAAGLSALTLDGLYRDEFTQQGMLRFRIAEDRARSVHALSPSGGVAFDITRRSFRQDPSPGILTGAARANAVRDSYALLLATESSGADGAFQRWWQALRWMPEPGATTPYTMAPLLEPRSFLSFRGAHRSAALVSESGRDPGDGRFKVRTHFLAAAPPVSVDGDLASGYRLLQPSLAYNVLDQQFHRIGAGLTALGVPRPLAPGGPSTGSYHVVGRR